MKKIITMLPSKGGVGQTFLATAIGIQMTKNKKKVLLVDNYAGRFTMENVFGMSDVVAFDLADVFKGNCGLVDVIYNTGIENLSFIPASRKSSDAVSCFLLKKIVKALSKYFDCIIIDTPVSFSYEFSKLVSISTQAIITSFANPSTVIMCPQISQMLRNAGVSDVRLVINKFSESFFRMNKVFEDLDAVIDTCEAQLLGIVPFDKKIDTISYLPQPSANYLGELEKNRINNKRSAFSAVQRITARIEGKVSNLAYC